MNPVPIAVTGIGAISSIGDDLGQCWANLVEGRSGASSITRFPTRGLRTRFAATVDLARVLRRTPPTFMQAAEALAQRVVEQAVTSSGLSPSDLCNAQLVVASPCLEADYDMVLRQLMQMDTSQARGALLACASALREPELSDHDADVARKLIEAYGFQGLPVHIDTACASGATIIQQSVEAIRRGETRLAIAVGVDIVRQDMIVRFGSLSALSTRNDDPQAASRPFCQDRDGFVFGEGGAALVLEDVTHAIGRGASILGYVLGCGEAGDCFHRTRSDPSAAPLRLAMERGLHDAGIGPEAIGYINAHGTSTPENDVMESKAIVEIFGPWKVPVSSSKSMIGHTVMAAGILEGAFTLLALAERTLPPTINHTAPDPLIELDVVPNAARRANIAYAISNSFGFGGHNVSIVYASNEHRV